MNTKIYRTHTYLPAIYKVETLTLMERIVKVRGSKDVFPFEQKGIIWLQRLAPHEQDDHEGLSIQKEKSKYGLD